MCVFVVFTLILILSISKPLDSQSVENGCWPYGIVTYDMDFKFERSEKILLHQQMAVINRASCVRFINVRDYLVLKEDPRKILYFVKTKTKTRICRIITSRRNGTLNVTISLGKGCVDKRTVLHDLLHILGFRHEHQRLDRDCYVKVNWDKVKDREPFIKDFTNPDNDWIQRFPYDKKSIMHFSRSIRLKSSDERLFEWEPLGNVDKDGSLTWWDTWKLNYKHCRVPHYCDLHPQHCADMERTEKSMDCQ